jgi:hypothetical protein
VKCIRIDVTESESRERCREGPDLPLFEAEGPRSGDDSSLPLSLSASLSSLGDSFDADKTIVLFHSAPIELLGEFRNGVEMREAVRERVRETPRSVAFWPTRSRRRSPDDSCSFVHFDSTSRPLVNGTLFDWRQHLARVQYWGEGERERESEGEGEREGEGEVDAYEDLSGRELLERAERGDCLYVAEILRLTGLGSLLPSPSLFAYGSVVDHRFDANLWLGSRGASSFAHYDTPHNVFLHLAGEKTFTLYPHGVVTEVGSHPFLHPLGRQLLSPPSLTHASLSLSLTLRPGDVLYLPPFIVHETNTGEGDPLSIGVNVWTEGEAARELERALRMPLPFETEWEVGTRLAAVASFASQVYPAAPAELWRQRVAPLSLPLPPLPCPSSPPPHLNKEKVEAVSLSLSLISPPSHRLTQLLNHLEHLILWAVQGEADFFAAGLRCVVERVKEEE